MLRKLESWRRQREERRDRKHYVEGYDQAVGAVLRGDLSAQDLRNEILSFQGTGLEHQHYDLGALDGLAALALTIAVAEGRSL